MLYMETCVVLFCMPTSIQRWWCWFWRSTTRSFSFDTFIFSHFFILLSSQLFFPLVRWCHTKYICFDVPFFGLSFVYMLVFLCVSHAELYSVWAINLFASLSSGLSFIRIKVQTHTQTHTHSTFQMCSSMWSEKSVRTVHIYSRDMERKLIWFFFFIPVCLIE